MPRVIPRYRIRVDESRVLAIELPLTRAERVAARAVSFRGRYDTAEVLDVDGAVVIAFARIGPKEQEA